MVDFSEFVALLQIIILMILLVASGGLGLRFLTKARSQLKCKLADVNVAHCTYTKQQLFRTETIHLPDNELRRAALIAQDPDLRHEGLKGQIALITRNGGYIIMYSSHLLGKRPKAYVREINRFLPNTPANGKNSSARNLTVKHRRERGPLFLLSILSIPLGAIGCFLLLTAIIVLPNTNFFTIWYIDKPQGSLTKTQLKLLQWQRMYYPLETIIKARKARKPRTRDEKHTVVLRRFSDIPLQLVFDQYGLTERDAQKITTQINNFLEST